MGTARDYWDRLLPPEQRADGTDYEAWEQQVHDAAEVLMLLGLPLSEDVVQQKLQLWGQRPTARVPEAAMWVPACGPLLGVPAFFQVAHTVGVAVRAQPSLESDILGVRSAGEVVAALGTNEDTDQADSDSRRAWIRLIEPDGPGFMLGDGRLAQIGSALLVPLPAGEDETVRALRRDFGRQIRQAEVLVLQHLRHVTRECLLSGVLPQWPAGLPTEGRDALLPRATAYNADAGLVLARGPGDFLLSPWRVVAGRAFLRSELVEACRIMPLQGAAGGALAPHVLALGDSGATGVPLGYGPLYRRAAGCGDRSEGTPAAANCTATLARWSGGGPTDHVLLVHADRDVKPGEELVLSGLDRQGGRPPCSDPWDRPPASELDAGGSQDRGYGDATGGLLRWGSSMLHGAGVFTTCDRPWQSILELCPALELDEQSRLAAADYSMGFRARHEGDGALAVLPLGFGALYNQSEAGEPPADYWYDRSLTMVAFVANKDIACNQEVFIDYGQSYWRNRGLPNPI